jgi:hypothetical protein
MGARANFAIATFASAALFGLTAGEASAAIFNLGVFNGGGNTIVWTGQVTVTDNGSTADFKFETTGPGPTVGAGPGIADIYFRQGIAGILSAIGVFDSSSGVAFSAPADPGDLPGGNTLSPPFVTDNTAGFQFASFDSDSPVADNEVKFGEFLTLRGTYATGQSFANLLPFIANQGIGVHVQSGCGTGTADSCSAVVPLPAAAWLLVSAIGGLGGLGWAARRRRENGSSGDLAAA